MTDDLLSMLDAAVRDERLSTGALYRDAAARIRELEKQLDDKQHRRLTPEQRRALASGSDAARLELWAEYYWHASDVCDEAEARADALLAERDRLHARAEAAERRCAELRALLVEARKHLRHKRNSNNSNCASCRIEQRIAALDTEEKL